jgi:hypothetical protein
MARIRHAAWQRSDNLAARGARAKNETPVIGLLSCGAAQQNAYRLTAYYQGIEGSGLYRRSEGCHRVPGSRTAADLLQVNGGSDRRAGHPACRGCSQSRQLDHPDRPCRDPAAEAVLKLHAMTRT